MNKKCTKILTLFFAFALIFSLAIPNFAEGTYAAPTIKITSGNIGDLNPSGTVIKYEITLYGGSAQTIKVGTKTLNYSDFTKRSDGTYFYAGTYNLTATTDLEFYVKDLQQQGGTEFREKFKFILDSSYPNLTITSSATNIGVFKIGLINIIVSDNYGIAKIEVNGTSVASDEVLKNKKAFAMSHEVYTNGTYLISVTDTAGNKTVGYAEYKDGEINTTVGTPNSVNSNAAYNEYLMKLYNENPMMYYYVVQNQYGTSTGTPMDMSWYYLMMAQNQNATTDSNSWLLYYLMNSEGGLENNPQLLYYLLSSNGEGANNNMLLYYLMSGNGEIDPALLMLLSGGSAGSGIPSMTDGNYLAYQYYYSSALNFVEGSSIKTSTKSGKMTMTAPKILDSSNASYQWQKIVDGSWKNVSGAISATLTVEPVSGDQYRVVITSPYFYTERISSTLTVTNAMCEDDKEVEDEEEETTDSSFTASDIKINGITGDAIRVKLGEKLILVPNYTGYWIVDNSMFSGNTAASNVVLTALKEGITVISFKATDSKGNTATKTLIVEVYK